MIEVKTGDCREVLRAMPAGSVHCCVTSPPYFGLRDYGHEGQIGLEATPGAYVAELVAVFAELRRVLRDDGTLWLNLGDSYAGAIDKQIVGRNDAGRKIGPRSGNKLGSGNPGPQRVFRPGNPDKNGGASSRDGLGTVAGLKPKDLIGIPWRVAFALQADGWFLRQDIIWHKPNPMPESVTDRCTKAHEFLFLLSKSQRYHFDAEAIAEPASYPEGPGTLSPKYLAGFLSGDQQFRTRSPSLIGARETRNKRSVWTVATEPYAEAHFACFPPALVEPCILAGCPEGGTVLDPFGGAGTTGLVADRLRRNAVLIELNPTYANMARQRVRSDAGMFAEVQ